MPVLPKEPQIDPESIFELREPWRVAHVRSRQEKVLARHLARNAIAFYLPQIERRSVSAGSGAAASVPLFPGYVFFRADPDQRRAALRSNVIAKIIEVGDQARLNAELLQIRRLQLGGASLIPVDEFVAGDFVRITDGAFAGYEGVVVRTARGDRLVVSVSLLRKTVIVEFPRNRLRRQRVR